MGHGDYEKLTPETIRLDLGMLVSASHPRPGVARVAVTLGEVVDRREGDARGSLGGDEHHDEQGRTVAASAAGVIHGSSPREDGLHPPSLGGRLADLAREVATGQREYVSARGDRL